jgi:hypothetical protein
MNLAQYIENLAATATPAELDALLRKADFDRYNAVGVDVLSPEQALRIAEARRNTFSADLTEQGTPAGRSWIESGPAEAVRGIPAAGNYEAMPMAA